MTVSWGFVHRNRKIGPLFGRSFGKCFAVISGLYRTPGRPRRTQIQGSRRPSQTADFSKLRQNSKIEENREIEQNRRLEAISQDLARSWGLADSWVPAGPGTCPAGSPAGPGTCPARPGRSDGCPDGRPAGPGRSDGRPDGRPAVSYGSYDCHTAVTTWYY